MGFDVLPVSSALQFQCHTFCSFESSGSYHCQHVSGTRNKDKVGFSRLSLRPGLPSMKERQKEGNKGGDKETEPCGVHRKKDLPWQPWSKKVKRAGQRTSLKQMIVILDGTALFCSYCLLARQQQGHVCVTAAGLMLVGSRKF